MLSFLIVPNGVIVGMATYIVIGLWRNRRDPRLTRQGYSTKILSDQFDARPAEIRRFLNGQLDSARTRELADKMRAAGLAL